MKNEVFKLAERIFGRYEGEVKVEEDRVLIHARNDFEQAHYVETECSVHMQKSKEWPIAIDCWEKTYSIRGGCGCPCRDLEQLEQELPRVLEEFKFRKRRQLSLFEED